MKNKLLTITLGVLIGVIIHASFFKRNTPDLPEKPIVILFENDVHCAVDGYAKLVSLREEQREQTPYMATVSCGDFVQGDIIGSLSKGESIVSLMNEVEYDVVTL